VRAAALFALVLELQGRGEAQIASIIDSAIDERAAAEPIGTGEDTRAWLDGVRHRLDMALT
jgi:hypothetical protein